jgi:hypothetical protein
MYESIEEAVEDLERILEYIEGVNFEEQFHVALEFGHQFKEELVTSDY